ncbi:MAG: CidA/LrgA family protein [Lachnospiraceae bacterium]|nr:CidA/LrgA family protein [Lachnospiraceae bacterium]
MKYIFQFVWIFGVSLAGEVLNALLPMPVPASVYGLVIMFILLLTGIVKLEQVENAADFLMAVMPLFFIDSTVGVMNYYGLIKGKIPILFLAAFLSFAAVVVVVGVTAQGIIRGKRKRGK